MENLLSVIIGIGLSAACGFRVFVPMLFLSAAGYLGYLRLAPGFEWIATPAALLAFATATLLEILAYYIPWVDHLLDVLAGPAALIAGVIASASLLQGMPPLLKWGIALIGGGGMAGITQGTTMLVRAKSGLFTGGLANPLVSTMELAASIFTSLLAIFLPVLALMFLLILILVICLKTRRFVFGRSSSREPREA